MSGPVRLAQKLFEQAAQAKSALASAVTTTTPPAASSTVLRNFTHFSEGDQVLLNGKRLSKPLKAGGTSPIPHGNGNISHDSILGRPLSTLRIDGPNKRYVKVQQPTLDEYISLTRRNVTPIYSSYATTITSLLDIHPPPPKTPSSTGPPYQILEAGTGHGSLTIHLARAIAAGNPCPPPTPLPLGRQTDPTHRTTDPAWSDFLNSRRAIIHTLERIPKNSHDAEKFVRGFRQGLYWPHIDFHVGDVREWVKQQLGGQEKKGKPFLSHVILDLPGVVDYLEVVAPAMLEDALVVVFCPSVTQIAECQARVKYGAGRGKGTMGMVFQQALELGEGVSTGRVWDVRLVRPREERVETTEDGGEEEAECGTDQDGGMGGSLKFVCRPRVGDRTIGGGFVGVWRKTGSV